MLFSTSFVDHGKVVVVEVKKKVTFQTLYVNVSLQMKTHFSFIPDMSRFHFVFKEVHLYRCQIQTPTGILRCSKQRGGETQELGEYNIVQTHGSWELWGRPPRPHSLRSRAALSGPVLQVSRGTCPQSSLWSKCLQQGTDRHECI